MSSESKPSESTKPKATVDQRLSDLETQMKDVLAALAKGKK
jgi:hypothetical protein